MAITIIDFQLNTMDSCNFKSIRQKNIKHEIRKKFSYFLIKSVKFGLFSLVCPLARFFFQLALTSVRSRKTCACFFRNNVNNTCVIYLLKKRHYICELGGHQSNGKSFQRNKNEIVSNLLPQTKKVLPSRSINYHVRI